MTFTFGKTLIEGVAQEFHRSPAGILKTLNESEIGMPWEWMLARYPAAEDPDRSRGGTVTPRYAIANLKDSLIQHLGETGTQAGCSELQRLSEKYPQFTWFRRVLLHGQEQLRRLTWQPLSPALLHELAENHRARLVQSGGQLLEVILDSLSLLQARLQGETPRAQFLWDGTHPKPEESISEFVKFNLEDDLKGRGVVLGREVQIHRFDRTDIHVTAVTQDSRERSFGSVKVIIEVKGEWHREVKTAMETQLVNRYLKNNDCRHGLYLVGWFGRRSRRKQAAAVHISLHRHLEAQATASSNADLTVKSLILDCSLRSPASPRRPKSAKKKTRR